MRKWKCMSVNEGNQLNFTVGKVYETDDNMFNFKLDNGYIFKSAKIVNNFDIKRGLVFEEVFDKKEESMKFDLKKEKIAVLCDTVEKVAKVCEVLGEKMFENFRVDNQARCYVGYDWETSGYVDGLLYDSYSYFTNKSKGYKLITFEEFMGEKEENKVEFKVGDVVEILGGTSQKYWNSDGRMKAYIGTKGKVVGVWDTEPKFKVRMDLDNEYWFFNSEDLKLVSEVPTQTFTITVSDSITTLKTNGKKVEINRYHTDKHDVEIAMQEVIDKYFMEIKKEAEKSNTPKVGDKVKVVNNVLTYDLFSEWLIQNNASVQSAIKWKSGEVPNRRDTYTVEMIVGETALIENVDSAYIISVKGLKVVE